MTKIFPILGSDSASAVQVMASNLISEVFVNLDARSNGCASTTLTIALDLKSGINPLGLDVGPNAGADVATVRSKSTSSSLVLINPTISSSTCCWE